MLNKYSTIFWDFDGVILDSDQVRTEGFKYIFDSYSKKYIDKLINYHTINGGLSRYEKIEYFSQKILDTKLKDQEKKQYAQLYGNYCRERLCDKDLLIKSSNSFIKENHNESQAEILHNFNLEIKQNQLKCQCLKCIADYRAKVRDHVYDNEIAAMGPYAVLDVVS